MRKTIFTFIIFNSLANSVDDVNSSNSFSIMMKERREKIKSGEIKLKEFKEGNYSGRLISKSYSKRRYDHPIIKERDENGTIIERKLNIGMMNLVEESQSKNGSSK